MAFLALVDAPLSSESMKFPVLCSKRHHKHIYTICGWPIHMLFPPSARSER
jgi:hypothetical protein